MVCNTESFKKTAVRIIICLIVCSAISCNTAHYVHINEIYNGKMDLNIDVNSMDIKNGFIGMYRGDMRGLIASILEAVFSPGKYSKDDAEALRKTILIGLKKNHMIVKGSSKKIRLDVSIEYFYMHINKGLPSSKFLTRIRCSIIDGSNKQIDEFIFSMFYKKFFYWSIGSLKTGVNEAIAYKIVSELINRYGDKKLNLTEYKNARYFSEFRDAEIKYENE